jgi:DNA replication protein DnaC
MLMCEGLNIIRATVTLRKGVQTMLIHPTLDKLQTLKLTGMFKALQDQLQLPECGSLSFEERLGLLVDREMTERENRRLSIRLRRAQLRQAASVEDIDYRHPRGLDKAVMLALSSCQWIADHQNCLITGPTGAGKSYLACALGQKACREGYSVRSFRVPRLFRELAIAKADGRYLKLLATLAKADLLILDDWGTERLSEEQRHDLFELVEDRYDRRSTLVAAQLPISHWHEAIGDPTLADAVLDRLIHNAHKLVLQGESLRKARKVSAKATPA